MDVTREVVRRFLSDLSPFNLVASALSWLPCTRLLLQLPVLSFLTIPSSENNGGFPYTSCPNAQLSCHNISTVADTCCFNYPGGQFLQTQFWDTSPAVGPEDKWTIHGLWPDHCDGGFDQFCDNGRKFFNISSIISSFDDSNALLDYMKKYWLPNRGSSETLWAHEWNKHGTCISTLDTKCYAADKDGSSPPHRYILDYFSKTVSLFKTLDTYKTLAAAGVHPSPIQTWSLEQLQKVFEASHGVPVTFRCRSGQLEEIWYHFDVRGSIQTGKFVPAAPDGPKSNCPAQGIKYLPKNDPSSPTSTAALPTSTDTAIPSPTSTSAPFTGKGFLHVYVDDAQHGCLIRSGQWYTSGTCASYSTKGDIVDPGHEQLFTLSSRFALCSINERNAFECDKTLPYQTIFSAEGNRLLFRNESTFYAGKVPGRFEKVDVYAAPADDDESATQHSLADRIEVEIRWSGMT